MARLLLLGESAQSARYLLGSFAHGGHATRQVEARTPLERIDEPFDVVLLSDYPSARLSAAATSQLVQAVQAGAGLVMIGGWTSFTGHGGDYGQTALAPLLPVVCAAADDRRNVASGLWFEAVAPTHPLLSGLALEAPPVLCGYNAVSPAAGATLVAQGRLVAFAGGRPVAGEAVPLLVAGPAGAGRVVAFTSDLTPHWCGGIVDWGQRRVRLPSGAEVGEHYIGFVLNLVRWAAGGD